MMTRPRVCAITGATGYVGGRIMEHLNRHGWQTLSWARRPQSDADHVVFQLGDFVDGDRFAGVGALVHCAYDFSPLRWPEIHAVNVEGSNRLFRAAQQAGVQRVVFISSLSAFEGCRSLYGRAKLETERLARAAGATIIRPGLVHGNNPGGVFGGLARQVRDKRVIPLIGGGSPLQYLVHEEDLGGLVERCIAGEVEPGAPPIALAHERAWTLRELLQALGAAMNRTPVLLPVPWRLAWLGLKAMERSGLRAPFRSDSLIGMVYQNPKPSFEAARRLGVECRPFQVAKALVS